MLIANLKAYINSTVDEIEAKYSTFLPFSGTYLEAFRAFLLKNINQVDAGFDRFIDEDADGLIDFLVDLAKGNLALPFYLRPFQSLFLEAIRKWLKSNKDVLRAKIGTLSY